jgi:hypothetical protein
MEIIPVGYSLSKANISEIRPDSEGNEQHSFTFNRGYMLTKRAGKFQKPGNQQTD